MSHEDDLFPKLIHRPEMPRARALDLAERWECLSIDRTAAIPVGVAIVFHKAPPKPRFEYTFQGERDDLLHYHVRVSLPLPFSVHTLGAF